MDSLNHQRTPLQPIQCEMCGQLKLIHSLGAQIMRSHAQLVESSAISWSSVARSSPLPKYRPQFHPVLIDNLNKRQQEKCKKQEESSSS